MAQPHSRPSPSTGSAAHLRGHVPSQEAEDTHPGLMWLKPEKATVAASGWHPRALVPSSWEHSCWLRLLGVWGPLLPPLLTEEE